MSTKQKKVDQRNGSVLLTVLAMSTVGVSAILYILGTTLYKYREAEIKICREQAFYIAQAGAERAATWVADGNEYDSTLSGNLDDRGSYNVTVNATSGEYGEITFDITSVGIVISRITGNPSVSRTVTMRGVRRVSWSRYALWYDQEAMTLWIAPGERFEGRVYSRPTMRFHHSGLSTKGQVVFTEHASTCQSSYQVSSSSVKPIFEDGISYNVERETMASVSFPTMLASAESGGLVLEGDTEIELVGSTMKITNSEEGWNQQVVSLPANGVLYVKGSTETSYEWVYNYYRRRWEKKWVTVTTGDVDVKAPSGLDGRLTIVSEADINIVDHIRYVDNPQSNPNSDDALGMIAKDNIVVETSAPDNVDIYAHMIAINGGFGVKDYNQGSSRGYLNVYGGIVNLIRNAVGIVGGSGYSKNYIYDTRFKSFPPPNYPALEEILEWTEWEG